MARVNYNVVTHGISGKVGDLLQFRQRYGKTIIAKIAAKSSKTSTNQQEIRDKFKQATAYAKSALKTPELLEIYQKRAAAGVTPYNLALKDFFSTPVIGGVELSAYTGAIGSTIAVQSSDDTKVAGVTILVYDSSNNLIETGAAAQQGEQDIWIFTATQFNNDPVGGKVVVEVRDLPGNVSTREFQL